MNAAVTGATGFVGGHVAHALLDQGARVACLARRPERAARFAARGARLVAGDLDDGKALRELVREAEVVYHVAGRLAAHAERDFYRVNRAGTELLSAVAREAGVRRVVYVSSLAATGPATPGAPVDDDTPPHPVSGYGRSKLAGEDALRSSGVAFTVIRPPTVYGPGDRETFKIFRLAKLGIVPLMGDGRQELSLIHVTDLVEALIAGAAAAGTVGGAYHAAHPDIVTQRAMVEAIGQAMGKRVKMVPLSAGVTRSVLRFLGTAASLARVDTLFTADKANEFLAPAWTCHAQRFEQEADWQARISHADGFSQTARWYRDHRWL